ncbi:MAG: diguanylate cyclase [Dehalococcoidia bacterium]|nr:diguanylate cyclase [Dehalococcoidia bacterium]
MVARLGGDEFTVLVQSTNAQATALRISERILHSLLRPFSLSGHEMFVSSSIGIAVSTQADRTSTDLLRRRTSSRCTGRRPKARAARPVHAGAGRDPRGAVRPDNALRRSVERQEPLLHYQPIVDLRSGISWGWRRCCAGTTRTGHPLAGHVHFDCRRDRRDRADRAVGDRRGLPEDDRVPAGATALPR